MDRLDVEALRERARELVGRWRRGPSGVFRGPEVAGLEEWEPPEGTVGGVTEAAWAYAVAAALYLGWEGEPPFAASSPEAHRVRQMIEPVPQVRTGLPEGVAAWMAAALEHDPAQRPTISALEALLAAPWASAPRLPPSVPPPGVRSLPAPAPMRPPTPMPAVAGPPPGAAPPPVPPSPAPGRSRWIAMGLLAAGALSCSGGGLFLVLALALAPGFGAATAVATATLGGGLGLFGLGLLAGGAWFSSAVAEPPPPEPVVAIPPPVEPKPLPRPFLLGSYECLALVGEGGMGRVYAARHRHLDRMDAVKVLAPGVAERGQAVALFQREAKMAAKVDHPNVVRVYDFGPLEGDLFFLSMELFRGVPLSALRGPLAVDQVLAILEQACRGLHAAHQQGIIHRDLKPDNLLVGLEAGRLRVKLVDFGIARPQRRSGVSIMGTDVVVGTPAWMSPEQARGETDLDARSDVFSLALIAWTLLTGRESLDGDHLTPWQVLARRGALEAAPPSAGSLRPGLPPRVDRAVARALSPDREARPATARDFWRTLSA